jgi:hypothetical protein
MTAKKNHIGIKYISDKQRALYNIKIKCWRSRLDAIVELLSE